MIGAPGGTPYGVGSIEGGKGAVLAGNTVPLRTLRYSVEIRQTIQIKFTFLLYFSQVAVVNRHTSRSL